MRRAHQRVISLRPFGFRAFQTCEVSETSQVLEPTQQVSNFLNSYAKSINRAYQRTGSLFQGRFGRIEVTSDQYFVRLVHYIHFNPQNLLDDTWYDLQPLGTEGQGTSVGGEPYKLDVMSVPHGVGFKFALTDKLDLGVEWGLRRTYTDHLDDVSGTYVDNTFLATETGPLTAALADPSVLRETGINSGRSRGDSYTRDWYQYTGVSLSVLLTKFTECDAIWEKMRNK